MHKTLKPSQHHIHSPHGAWYEAVYCAAVSGMCANEDRSLLAQDSVVKEITHIAHDIAMSAVAHELNGHG
jgi:hypothetical protein